MLFRSPRKYEGLDGTELAISESQERMAVVLAPGDLEAFRALADGLEINLNAVPKKYEGLDGTELAISESQERMAVVVAAEDVDAFLKLAGEENLQACPVAVVKEEPRLRMNWNGKTIVDISRDFLNSNGAPKHIRINPAKPEDWQRKVSGSFTDNMKAMATDLNMCSKRGLGERFDSTIGAGTVIMPFLRLARLFITSTKFTPPSSNEV